MTEHRPKYDLIVIGAGISGLTAAYKAAKAGGRVCVIEAGNWVGGRIGLTENHISTGAEFIHGDSGHIWNLLEEFGLKTYPYPGGSRLSRYFDESFSLIPDIGSRIAAIRDQIYNAPKEGLKNLAL